MKRIILILVLLLLFSFSASAEDIYKEQYDLTAIDELQNSLGNRVKEFFSDFGIDPSDSDWVNKLDGENIFLHVIKFLK
ncbi:MAG: hypothetical protein J6V50_04460 [Clostridia bacterium]|nr:hypothetical protein [Clostridia bacterium]